MSIEETRLLIMRLSEKLDLIGLRTQVLHKTKYGKRPHPTDPWGHTRSYMAYYAEQTDADEVIAMFTQAGAQDELQAMRWLLKHDEIVP